MCKAYEDDNLHHTDQRSEPADTSAVQKTEAFSSSRNEEDKQHAPNLSARSEAEHRQKQIQNRDREGDVNDGDDDGLQD